MHAEVPTIAQERRGLAQHLRDLAPDQWDRPSLCEGWTVRHVLAHLVTPFAVSTPAMAVSVLRRRGVAAAMDAAARRIAVQRTPEELLDLLQANAESSFRPPGMPLAAPLTDAVAHGADIRWALGDDRRDWGSPERLAPVLEFLVSPGARRAFRPRADGRELRLVCDDQDWWHGTGAEVVGSSLALVMGLLGREPAYSCLDGPGVERLRSAPAW